MDKITYERLLNESIDETLRERGIDKIDEISLAGLKNMVSQGVSDAKSTFGGIKNTFNSLNKKFDQISTKYKDAYYSGNIKDIEIKLIDMIIASIDKINLTLEKSNRPPIDPNTLIMSISNRARTAYKKRMSGDMYKSTGNYINQ